MDNEEAPRKFNWSLFDQSLLDGRTEELTNIKASITTEHTFRDVYSEQA